MKRELDICRECGGEREDHHGFVAVTAPEGCMCPSEDWNNPEDIPEVCGKFTPMSERERGLCATCEHEEPCHAARPADKEDGNG